MHSTVLCLGHHSKPHHNMEDTSQTHLIAMNAAHASLVTAYCHIAWKLVPNNMCMSAFHSCIVLSTNANAHLAAPEQLLRLALTFSHLILTGNVTCTSALRQRTGAHIAVKLGRVVAAGQTHVCGCRVA